jgi:hypothetical protein
MNKKVKKAFKIIGWLMIFTFLMFSALMVYNYVRIQRGELIKWEGRYYSREKLREMFPPQYYEVPAKNTPEETYTAFRQALLDNKKEEALEHISEKNRQLYREAFEDEERLSEWVKKLPEEIIKEDEYGNFSNYYYLNAIDLEDNIAHFINFKKTLKVIGK